MNVKTKIMLIALITVIATLFLLKPIQSMVSGSGEKDKKDENKNEKSIVSAKDNTVTIIKKWEVPAELLEVSGIAWISDNRFACVQDEEGIIYIFNLSTLQIEKKIPFAGAGDYEGIAVAGESAFIMRADGLMYLVSEFNKSKPDVRTYKTHLTVDQDVEGLTYDKKNNRILAAIKGYETDDLPYKGIYAFDIQSGIMHKAPVHKLMFSDTQSKGGSGKKKKVIQPSEIAIHPVSGDIYITDASGPSLVILSPQGSFKSRHFLDKKVFAQPEGMTFSPAGDLYISNEGKKISGNILLVSVKDTN